MAEIPNNGPMDPWWGTTCYTTCASPVQTSARPSRCSVWKIEPCCPKMNKNTVTFDMRLSVSSGCVMMSFCISFHFFKFQGLHECIVCVSYEEKHILSPPNPGNSTKSGWHPNKDSSRIRGRFFKVYTVRGTFSNPHLGSEDSHESWVEAGFVNPPQYGCFRK